MSNCKYYKEKKQISYDGQTFVDTNPLVTRRGRLYSRESSDCNNA